MYSVDSNNPKSWDEYFFNNCKTIASNSKCLSRKIGAVIVKDNSIISAGYNGPPRGVRRCDERWLVDKSLADKVGFYYPIRKDQGIWRLKIENKCPRYVPDMGYKSGEGLEWCVAGHAERNAIVNAARLGTIALKGTKIYMSCGVPCTPCLVEIINAGIEEIICTDFNFYDTSGKYLLKESGIKIRLYDFIEYEE